MNLALLIEREEHAETIMLRATKARGVTVLPFGAMFSYKHKRDSDELAEARFFGVEVEDTTSTGAIERAIIEVVKGNAPITKGGLRDEVKALLPDVGVNRIRNAVDWLAHGGQLAMDAGKHGAKLYSLPKHDEITYTEAVNVGD